MRPEPSEPKSLLCGRPAPVPSTPRDDGEDPSAPSPVALQRRPVLATAWLGAGALTPFCLGRRDLFSSPPLLRNLDLEDGEVHMIETPKTACGNVALLSPLESCVTRWPALPARATVRAGMEVGYQECLGTSIQSAALQPDRDRRQHARVQPRAPDHRGTRHLRVVSGAGVYPAIVIATHVLASVRGVQAHVHADVLRIRWWLRLCAGGAP